jgi:hypothetical protein
MRLLELMFRCVLRIYDPNPDQICHLPRKSYVASVMNTTLGEVSGYVVWLPIAI